MTAIAASSVRISTLVDGTLRLVCDVEPKDAQACFALFASPGTPMALAALKPAGSKPEKQDKPKMGPLCSWAVMRCKEPKFREWISIRAGEPDMDEERAAQIIRATCNVESRTELDTDKGASFTFLEKVMKPYGAWLEKNP